MTPNTTYESLAEQYEMLTWLAAEHFAQTHPELYRRMSIGAFAGYYGTPAGDYMLRQKELDRSAAAADGLPSFDRWLNTLKEAA